MSGCLTPSDAGVLLDIHVQPRASRNELAGLQGDCLKLRLTSPPVEGAANKACREFIAKLLGVAKSRVTLVSGDKSRHKRLLIEGMTVEEVRSVLS
ncbi:MAG: DUF167 domain-containing protein [Syntrophotalea acetylenica]|jgi:hypothetical protein|uniref:UPF0235 protein A7E75_03995 n=1 Tax=Syntrophotalea acetylenica TaxID=29542 RepID=A0A1L3GEN7_SYNAC|nr:DUF167 domain-containing protein [Syntrophotalea acetylenica]APG24289.1 YggU family protein [Syntrophotalea acetylenica]APG44871.1 hypothetical protein A6070_12630 [Syntrophotalea acetylenica]MDD4457987.1 DUF167 domain-containing protein [Syntrophotalea acetylenica]MDY0261765.1 DUF167 domain-containing protein [Syntrophotalea acetylenica]